MQLTVEPQREGSLGEGLARVGREPMATLGIDSGEYALLRASDDRRAVTQVMAGEVGDSAIRLGERIRRSLAVDVDETVAIEPAEVRSANRVTVGLSTDIDADENPALYFRDELVGLPVIEGQTLQVAPGSSDRAVSGQITVQVVGTDPGEAVVVRDWTRIRVSPRSTDEITVDDGLGGPQRGGVTYADLGGLGEELDRMRELVEFPLRNPDLFGRLGVDPPTGVLIHGPPGTGKSLLATAVANEVDAHFRTLSGTEIISKHFEDRGDDLGLADLPADDPVVVFVEDLDSVAGGREGGDIQRWAVAQLLSLLEEIEDHGRRVVLGETSHIEDLDPALRRAGRFDREIELGVPDQEGREEILRIHTRDVPLAETVDLGAVASNTHGFVGADLANLVTEAATQALGRLEDDHDLDGDVDPAAFGDVTLTAEDFSAASRGTEPSALREVFVEVPDVSWDDVGGLDEATRRLKETVEWPLSCPEAFERVGLDPTKGVLLYGPPGTGKTLLAKAVANEAQSNFISVKGPELFDKYVGESEKGVREIFSTARENAPAVIFFDEIDAIATERGRGSGGSNVGERVVSQLLTELDGLEELEDVVVIAATNRPDLLDSALTRAGRLERKIEVGDPDEEARREIMAIHARDRPLADDVDLDQLAADTDGFVGADLAALCREAATRAVREYFRAQSEGEPTAVEDIVLTQAHFVTALGDVETEDAPLRSGTGDL